ncbi:hypothetical protein CEXT_556241 [Caerostris extrusa]|uniref:Uncharacterized protein n=1 Tax=Caerostris extrusa TaxID=172846 RepID=A0AAV4X1N0_CAEEX|nr:hypothetical protein CEXT_556241 [Caerostris extrusa]
MPESMHRLQFLCSLGRGKAIEQVVNEFLPPPRNSDPHPTPSPNGHPPPGSEEQKKTQKELMKYLRLIERPGANYLLQETMRPGVIVKINTGLGLLGSLSGERLPLRVRFHSLPHVAAGGCSGTHIYLLIQLGGVKMQEGRPALPC